MKAETILDSLNFLDDEIIIETDRLRKTPRQVRSRWPWLKWGAAAACLLAALWMTSKLWPAARLEPSPEAELPYLPVLTVSDILADSMGFEGLMAFDISELTNANPWTEDITLTTLPVYRNQQDYEENYYPVDVDWEQMNELLLETAGKLCMDTGSLNIAKESGWSNYLKTEQDGTVITVWSSMEIQIILNRPYHFLSNIILLTILLMKSSRRLLSICSLLTAICSPRTIPA